ncbi:MAG TPA: exosortase N, partial [Chitinophaga sp.]|nr:exosortase N [Chitinophaga sp.]
GRFWPLLVISCYAITFLLGLQEYIVLSSAGFLLGIVALYSTATFNSARKGGLRFFILTCLLFLLYICLPARTLLYLSLAGACLFLCETFYGRISFLPLIVLCIMSPLFDAGMNIFSFPVRLQLSAAAGNLVALSGLPVSVQGNTILFNGNEFTVDPACMGLQMMVTSLLCGLILIGIYQKRAGKTLRILPVAGLLFCIVLLNILSNLLRIICLVWLNILPGTMAHDLVGVICLGVYVLAPMLPLIQLAVNRYGKKTVVHRKRYTLRSAGLSFLLNILLAGLMLTGAYISQTNDLNKKVLQQVATVPGYTQEVLPGYVIKLENDSLLVYIKHIPSGYYSEHHPMMCWKGSGYNFYKVQETMLVNGKKIYTALLQQGNKQLYTAWWYDNGLVTTISQMEWRWDVLCGAHPYSLVNMTAATEQELKKGVTDALRRQPFKPLL